MLVKYKPTVLSGMLDDFFNDRFKAAGQDMVLSSPAINVKENGDSFKVEMAAPGLNKEDFRLDVKDNILSVFVQKEEKHEEEDERFTRREFSYSSFERSFNLPENTNVEKIDATYKDGLLCINIPKTQKEEKKEAKKIQVS
ncbi:Hsp20/alpha crystallin family protein [Cytophagaceae bacterium ABcell3]|nr:Hsp20/alpha crystallin family protein [Cytophagaceae bacterium ABcell3]